MQTTEPRIANATPVMPKYSPRIAVSTICVVTSARLVNAISRCPPEPLTNLAAAVPSERSPKAIARITTAGAARSYVGPTHAINAGRAKTATTRHDGSVMPVMSRPAVRAAGPSASVSPRPTSAAACGNSGAASGVPTAVPSDASFSPTAKMPAVETLRTTPRTKTLV